LGGRKGIRPVKSQEWWGAGVVVCLKQGADLHMAQLMPLSLASVKSRVVLPFWYRLTWVVPEKRPLNVCVCVRACARARVCYTWRDGAITCHYMSVNKRIG